MPRSRYFHVDWVLIDSVAIGPAPRHSRHLNRLRDLGIKGILSLCSKEEAMPPQDLSDSFVTRRFVLPDHRAGRLPDIDELRMALGHLSELSSQGAVYVHCVAAMERSPLVCLGWLVQQQNMSPNNALDYLMQQHPGTNPLPGQLKLLEQLRGEGESDLSA